MDRIRRGAAWMAILVLTAAGCTATRKITTRYELQYTTVGEKLTVYASSGRVFQLTQHALADSVLRGTGTVTQDGDRSPFVGTIPLSEIEVITSERHSPLRTFAALGVTALFVGYLIETADKDGLHPTETVVYHGPPSGGGTSCPYAYVWDGEDYVLQAEPFGIAWGRALELTTTHLLPRARPERGLLRARLTNERRETHYLNSVRAFAIDLGAAEGAVLDGEGRAWPLATTVQPDRAYDPAGRDILPLVSTADGETWERDVAELQAASGFEDVLELTFPRPAGATHGTLVFTGSNTDLWATVLPFLTRAVDGRTVALAHAIETDEELIARLRGYLDDASLGVRLWNGRAWEPAGGILPEASAVEFSRGLRLEVPRGAGDTLRVRLRSLADVWKIDALAMQWGEAKPLATTPLELVAATGPDGRDVREDIVADDRRYEVLVPPDQIDLVFRGPPGEARVAFAMAARGYLHEWDPIDTRPVADTDGRTDAERIAFLKQLLQHRDLVLGPVYEAWRTRSSE